MLSKSFSLNGKKNNKYEKHTDHKNYTTYTDHKNYTTYLICCIFIIYTSIKQTVI